MATFTVVLGEFMDFPGVFNEYIVEADNVNDIDLEIVADAVYNELGGDEYHEYDFSKPNFDEGMSEDVKDFLQPEFEYWLDTQEEEEDAA